MPRSSRFRTALALAVMALSASAVAAQPIRVTDKVSAQKGGAKVDLISAYRSPEDALREPAPIASTRTAGDGSFELTAPGSGCYKVVIRSGGSWSKEHPLVPLVEETELLPTDLEEPRPLEIRTVGPDGRPLPGVEILATSEPYPESLWPGLSTWWIADRRVTTGANGTVVLPHASYEFLKLTAISPRFLHEVRLERAPERSGPVILRLSPRERTPEPSVRPEPPRVLAGKVVDAASGLPVAGAVVWSGNPLNAPPVRSGADGSFRLEAPSAPEGIRMNAAAAGYLMAERRFVTRKETGPIRLALDPAASLSGVVVDPEGRPVPGASIEPAPQAQRSLNLIRSQGKVRTGPDGRFRLTGLLPTGTYELTATVQGFATTRRKARTAAPGRPSPEVRIVLDPGRTVLGQVIDEGGRPIAGAALLLFINQRFGQITERFKASSDDTGRFEIRGVSPGPHELLVQRAGFAQTHRTEVLIPAETKTADLGAITLAAGSRTRNWLRSRRSGRVRATAEEG